MYRIVTGVTSDVGVPSTYLVSYLNHPCEIVPPISILRVFQEVPLAQPASVCLLDAYIECFKQLAENKIACQLWKSKSE